jgi:hypothetical protein
MNNIGCCASNIAVCINARLECICGGQSCNRSICCDSKVLRLSIKNPIRLGWEESNLLNVEPERVQSLIKDGYDGAFGVGDADDVFEYIAFFPNQIKSAIEK